MGEKRAVQISHELWKQIMTQGYTGAGHRCIEGIPEDAQFATAFPAYVSAKPDPVFVFESDNWGTPTPEYTAREPFTDEAIPLMNVVFQVAECRTCKWWGEYEAMRNWADCTITTHTRSKALVTCDDINIPLRTEPDFGCTQYEPKETDD